MSDVAESGKVGAESVAAVPVAETAAPAMTSAGRLLREAREAAGVDLGALAVALKVSVKRLESLEADRLDQLPDAVFVRALASSVCRALKTDAAPVLALLPQTVAPRLQYDDESGLHTPFHTPGDIAKTPFWDRLSRPMVLAALAVLMGALVLIFFPSSEQRAEIGAIVARPAVPAPVEQPAVQAPVPSTAPALVAPAAPATPAAALSPAKVAVPTPVKAAPAPPAPSAVAPSDNAEAAAVRKKVASSGVVVFKTSSASWIEVTDGRGAIQLSRMVEPGEPVGASGPLPLNVTIGRADVTEVLVRGKPFSLEGVTRGGVARFEVK